MNLHEFANRMPKAELHVHLEGSIRPPTLLALADRNGVKLPAQDVDGLEEFYRFRDFDHFIEVYLTITRCLRTVDDYRLIAYEFGADRARMNVRHTEATFSVETNARYTGLPWQEIVAGLNAGRAQAHEEYGVDWRWVFDIVRNLPETQDTVVDIVLAARDDGVVALGLGGSEHDFPPELFVRSHERALAEGVPRVPHAGETAGPQSVWNAIKLLHADRLGHGVRSAEDPALIEYLIETQIAIEACPTSNIRLGVYPNYDAHPLRELWDANVLVTVNSDDPPMFGTDLNMEYSVLIDHFGFTADELEQASLNGVQASLLPEDEKARLAAEFRSEFASLRQALAAV
jgi:aminodeoxyfutalosine deaminase